MHWIPTLTILINTVTMIVVVKYAFMIKNYLIEIDIAKTFMESYRKEMFGELDVLNLKLTNNQNKIGELKKEIDFMNYEMKDKK